MPIQGWKDCKFEMIGQLNQSSNVIQMDLKLKRINREQYAISGSVNVFEDMLTDYTVYHIIHIFISSNMFDTHFQQKQKKKKILTKVDADAYYSAYGNNQFTQLPYKFKPKILCDALNTYYREFWMNELEPPISDLPFSKDKNTNLCPMFIKVCNINVPI